MNLGRRVTLRNPPYPRFRDALVDTCRKQGLQIHAYV